MPAFMADTAQDTNQVIATERMFRMDRNRFMRAVINNTQALQRSTAGDSVKYEIHRPNLLGRRSYFVRDQRSLPKHPPQPLPENQ